MALLVRKYANKKVMFSFGIVLLWKKRTDDDDNIYIYIYDELRELHKGL
jgi:hypothetical protein